MFWKKVIIHVRNYSTKQVEKNGIQSMVEKIGSVFRVYFVKVARNEESM